MSNSNFYVRHCGLRTLQTTGELDPSRPRVALIHMSSVRSPIFIFPTTEAAHLKSAGYALLDDSRGEVRFYYLCPTCHERTEMTFPGHQTDNLFAVIA